MQHGGRYLTKNWILISLKEMAEKLIDTFQTDYRHPIL